MLSEALRLADGLSGEPDTGSVSEMFSYRLPIFMAQVTIIRHAIVAAVKAVFVDLDACYRYRHRHRRLSRQSMSLPSMFLKDVAHHLIPLFKLLDIHCPTVIEKQGVTAVNSFFFILGTRRWQSNEAEAWSSQYRRPLIRQPSSSVGPHETSKPAGQHPTPAPRCPPAFTAVLYTTYICTRTLDSYTVSCPLHSFVSLRVRFVPCPSPRSRYSRDTPPGLPSMANKRLSSLNTAPTLPVVDGGSPLSMTPNSPDRGRLRKHAPAPASAGAAGHSRSASAQYTPRPSMDQPSLQEIKQTIFSSDAQPSPLMPPPSIGGGILAGPGSRSSSMDRSFNSRPSTPTNYSRPGTPTLIVPGQSPTTPTSKKEKKKSWFGSSKKDNEQNRGPWAWIAGHPQRLPFDTTALASGRPIQELWENGPDGNCYVYLFPRETGRGASFKIDSAVFASSPVLCRLAFGDAYMARQPPLDARMQGVTLYDTPPATSQRNGGKTETMSSTSSHQSTATGRMSALSDGSSSPETHLYLPIKLHNPDRIPSTVQPPAKAKDRLEKDPGAEDLQTLVDIRNFFAFLCGQALIATERRASFFHIFMTIAGILRSYDFSNLDGSTFGEIASNSFDLYVGEIGLADVRASREKTIEGIVLGERMKSIYLYNEAFTHAAGKHDDLVALQSQKFELLSGITKNRLVRAAMDLERRLASTRLILTDFDFPSLFSGIMASKMSIERKEGVRFEAWKDGFMGFRKNLLAYLKRKYGDWPPKASSKKNTLETSGLSRLVLRDLYEDLSSLYDLIADRTQLTSRTVDGISPESSDREEPTTRGLRSVLSEYDRSSPPVKPPIPFDMPLLPSLKSTRSDFGVGDKKKDVKAIQKKVKDDEVDKLLSHASNPDVSKSTFLDMFRDMERRAAHSCTIAEMVDLRFGQWIFMYVVLQALPMLACDAPSLKHTKGVEYFLCEPPRSGVPWANPNVAAAAGRQTWFSVGEGGGVVQLPSDVVEHGVEGIYRRSHAWVAAEKWSQANPILNSALHEQEAINRAKSMKQRRVDTMSSTRLTTDGLPAPPPKDHLLTPVAGPGPGSRPSSRQGNRNSSIGLNLEALPLPYGVTPDGSLPTTNYAGVPVGSPYGGPGPMGGPVGSRPTTPSGEFAAKVRPPSAYVADASKTFDAILGSQDTGKKGKRK